MHRYENGVKEHNVFFSLCCNTSNHMAIIHNNVYKRTSSEHFYANALQHMLITHTHTDWWGMNCILEWDEWKQMKTKSYFSVWMQIRKGSKRPRHTHTHRIWKCNSIKCSNIFMYSQFVCLFLPFRVIFFVSVHWLSLCVVQRRWRRRFGSSSKFINSTFTCTPPRQQHVFIAVVSRCVVLELLLLFVWLLIFNNSGNWCFRRLKPNFRFHSCRY